MNETISTKCRFRLEIYCNDCNNLLYSVYHKLPYEVPRPLKCPFCEKILQKQLLENGAVQ